MNIYHNNNPWAVDSVQAFSCLKCPECTFITNQETLFQDHAVENHTLSIALFGKIKSLYIPSVLFGEETDEELDCSNTIEGENIVSEPNSNYKTVQLKSSEKDTLVFKTNEIKPRVSNPKILSPYTDLFMVVSLGSPSMSNHTTNFSLLGSEQK